LVSQCLEEHDPSITILDLGGMHDGADHERVDENIAIFPMISGSGIIVGGDQSWSLPSLLSSRSGCR